MNLLEMALTVASKYPVFPCLASKAPATPHGFKDASRDPAEIRRMFALPGAALVGVPTGKASGLLVVDVDPAGEGWLDVQRLVLPTTREHSTRRGTHLLFRMPAEPIGCSTGRIAPGVDVRADGGFVIWWAVAGLPFKAEALADVPAAYLDALRRPALADDDHNNPMSLSHKERVGTPIEGAQPLLDRISPDCDYDTWYRVGLALEHEYGDAGLALWRAWSSKGAKYPGDSEIESKWASFGRGDGPPVTFRYILKLVKEQRAEAAAPAPVEGRNSPFRIVRATDLMAQKPPGWIIRDLIPQADLGMLFAVGGAGKTFFTLDVALHIATGVQWRDKTTKRGRVLYICAEGSGGFGVRMKAALQANGNLAAGMVDAGTVFEVLPGAPNFLDDKAIAALVEQAKGLGGFDVVIIDTVAQVTPGGNENTGEDMGRMIGNCRRFNAAFGAFVLLLHHPGKDATKGARGWSGMFGALDVELEITRNGEDRTVRVSKQKEGTDGARFGFRLEPQPVDGATDADGFPVISCRVEATADLSKNGKPTRKMGVLENAILTAAADLASVCGGPFNYHELFKAYCVVVAPPPTGADRRAEGFTRSFNRLVGDKLLTRNGDLVELAQ